MTALVPGDRVVPWSSTLHISAPLDPLKIHVSINDDVVPEDTDPEAVLRYVDIGNVTATGDIAGIEDVRFEDAPSRARRRVRYGDTILSTVRTYLRAIAYVDRAAADIVCSTGFAVVRPRETLDSKYLYYWLRSDLVVDEVCARSVGVSYPAFNASELGALPIPRLPLDQQARVARFLDSKCRVLDALVAKEDHLVGRLQEKRHTLVTQAVTKGLDPGVPMKESGVEWIGRVPAHWKVMRLKQISTRVVVGIAQAATHAYADDGVPIIRSTNVRANRIDLAELLFIDRTFADSLRSKYLRPGDLLTVRTGNAGVTAVVPDALPLSQCFTMLITSLRREHFPAYFSFQLNSDPGRVYFGLESWGSAQENISVPILQNAPVAVPPPDEQRRIASAIATELQALDGAIDRIARQRATLLEYRQALITAAVTGQIDVGREAAA